MTSAVNCGPAANECGARANLICLDDLDYVLKVKGVREHFATAICART